MHRLRACSLVQRREFCRITRGQSLLPPTFREGTAFEAFQAGPVMNSSGMGPINRSLPPHSRFSYCPFRDGKRSDRSISELFTRKQKRDSVNERVSTRTRGTRAVRRQLRRGPVRCTPGAQMQFEWHARAEDARLVIDVRAESPSPHDLN